MLNYFPYSFVSIQQSLQQLHHKFDHRFHHNYLIGWPNFFVDGTWDVIIISKFAINNSETRNICLVRVFRIVKFGCLAHMKYIFCRLNAVNQTTNMLSSFVCVLAVMQGQACVHADCGTLVVYSFLCMECQSVCCIAAIACN